MKTATTFVLGLLAVLGLALTAAPAQGQAAEATLTGATQLTAGDDFTCVRLASAQARCWGDNDNGQLGDNSGGTDRDTAVTVLNQGGGGPLTGVRQVDAGGDHACAALANGQVRCWGDNDNGQLGDNDFPNDSDLPVTVLNQGGGGPLTGVVAVQAGDDYSCARLGNGQVRCWGDNLDGQLGNDDTADTELPVTVLAASGAALTGVTAIEAGGDHMCAVLTSAQARCWGNGGSGRLGNNATADQDRATTVKGVSSPALTGVTQLSGGDDHSCARLNTGKAVCWGDNNSGEQGDATNSDNLRPAVVANGGGDGDLAGVSSVDANDGTTCARLSTGQARCWGDGDAGQIGNNTNTAENILPKVVRNVGDTGPLTGVSVVVGGSDHSCALLTNGQVRCWGDNLDGQLGDDDVGVDKLLPVVVEV